MIIFVRGNGRETGKCLSVPQQLAARHIPSRPRTPLPRHPLSPSLPIAARRCRAAPPARQLGVPSARPVEAGLPCGGRCHRTCLSTRVVCTVPGRACTGSVVLRAPPCMPAVLSAEATVPRCAPHAPAPGRRRSAASSQESSRTSIHSLQDLGASWGGGGRGRVPSVRRSEERQWPGPESVSMLRRRQSAVLH